MLIKKKNISYGFTLIELLVVLGILVILLGLALTGVQKSRAVAQKIGCANNLKNIGLALHNYHVNYHHLPPGMCQNAMEGKFPFLSWNSLVLPFLEEDFLFQEIVDAYAENPSFLRVPPHVNRSRVVKSFLCPSDWHSATPYQIPIQNGDVVAFTDYLGVEGTNQFNQDGTLFMDSTIRFEDITDGLSSTLLVGERPPSFDYSMGWWYAGWGFNKAGSAEMVLGVREIPENTLVCPSVPAKFQQGTFESPCDFLHFWSYHSSGSQFLFADGSVKLIPYDSDSILPALATRANGDIPQEQ